MFAEAIKAIVELGRESRGARILTTEREPKHVYWLEKTDGTLDRFEADPAPRQHMARDMSAVVEFAKRFSEMESRAVVWYSRTQVVCLLDDGTRRDAITLPLGPSPQMATLAKWEASKPVLPQAEAVLILRTTFERCTEGNLIDVLRRVKFRQTVDGGGTVEHGKASIGRSLEAEITGAGAIPEYTTFHVPVFAAAVGHHAMVRCAVEPNPGTATITFVTLPGELERAWADAEATIGETLRAALPDVPVYYGSP